MTDLRLVDDADCQDDTCSRREDMWERDTRFFVAVGAALVSWLVVLAGIVIVCLR